MHRPITTYFLGAKIRSIIESSKYFGTFFVAERFFLQSFSYFSSKKLASIAKKHYICSNEKLLYRKTFVVYVANITFWGQTKNHYYLILTKKDLSGSYDAMIEYSDLIELNKAFARLLGEVDDDVKLKTEYNYLENKYVTNDQFKLGYYIEKRKAKWFVKFAPNIPLLRITYQKEFCKFLNDAQEKIEQIMAREGK